MFNFLFILTFVAGILLSVCPALADDNGDLQCTMITVVKPVMPASQSTTKDLINKYFPKNLRPSTDSNAVLNQMEVGVGQRITDDLISSDLFKRSVLGQATSKVENFSQKSVAVGNHSSLDFKVKVVERQAVMAYKGPVDSQVIYVVDQNAFKWILSKAVSKVTTVALTTVAAVDGSSASSILSLSHSF